MIQLSKAHTGYRTARRRLVRLTELFAVILFFVCLLLSPGAVAPAVRNALRLCGTTLIPALFPMLAAARFFVVSGLSDSVGRRLTPLFRPLFGLCGAGCGIFAAGFLSGFPAGAAMTGDAYETGQLCRTDAERLLALANNPSPAFLLFFVGGTLFGSLLYGALLLVCQTAAVLTVAIASAPLPVREHSKISQQMHAPTAFARAVSSATTACVGIVGFVLFFSVAAALCEPFFLRLPPYCAPFIHALLELCGGLPRVFEASAISMPLTAFFVSFCGFSVHAQVASLVPPALSMRPYMRLRLLITAATVCYAAAFSPSTPFPIRLFLLLAPISLAALWRCH